jgi:hypothetical protein
LCKLRQDRWSPIAGDAAAQPGTTPVAPPEHFSFAVETMPLPAVDRSAQINWVILPHLNSYWRDVMAFRFADMKMTTPALLRQSSACVNA